MRIENALEKDVKLPVGIDVEGKLYDKVKIREVLGLDEEFISQPRFKNNPASMMVELVGRCIVEVEGLGVDITPNVLRNSCTGALDYLFLQIRNLSAGGEYEVVDKCSNGHKYKDYINLEDDLVVTEGTPVIDIKLPRGLHKDQGVVKNIKLAFPDGNLQEFFVKKGAKKEDLDKFGEINTEVIYRCISKVNPELKITRDDIKMLSRKDRKYITNYIQENAPGINTEITCVCDTCEDEFIHTVNPFDFLQ
jgi:sporulation protein YlmC with PRC-barrel domain